MAKMDFIEFSSREEALQEFARTIGTHPPRDPIPEWWNQFELWYLSKISDPSAVVDGKIRLMVRMEPFEYDEEDLEGPLLEDDEPELDDEPDGV